VGMVIVCAPENVSSIKAHFESIGETSFEIGKVIEGNREVSIQ